MKASKFSRLNDGSLTGDARWPISGVIQVEEEYQMELKKLLKIIIQNSISNRWKAIRKHVFPLLPELRHTPDVYEQYINDYGAYLGKKAYQFVTEPRN